MSLSKKDYLEGLQKAGVEEGIETTPEKEPTPPPENPPEPAPEAPPESGASALQAPEKQEPEAKEPIKGWNLLSDETKAQLQEQWNRAAKLEEDLKRREHEYQQSQSRLVPTQQQLAKIQADYAKAQKKLREHESKYQETLNSDTKKRLEALKASYPDEADVIESLTAQARQEAEAARREAAEARKRTEALEQRQAINEELMILSKAHSDWYEARNSQEFNSWYSALDGYKQGLISERMKSTKAADAIFVLNEFKHDLAWAQALNGQQQETQEQHESASPVATQAPVPDPDPSRRATAPSQSAGQPMSDKKREFIKAAEFLEKQRRRAG